MPYINHRHYRSAASGLSQSPAWQALSEHRTHWDSVSLRELFAQEPQRFDRYHQDLGPLLFDFSKNLIDETTLTLLIKLADQQQLTAKRDAMFAGELINNSERRAVLHVASRNRSSEPVYFQGKDVMPEVRAELAKMRQFIDALYAGQVKGHRGQAITDVINLGVGGSDLGGVMVTEALRPWLKTGVRVHFVSTMDGTQLMDLLPTLNPDSSLFLLCSKSLTTIDTLSNVDTAKKWLASHLGTEQAWPAHFAAISANTDVMQKFGIPADRQFLFGDWIGGRYSVSSAIGLPVAIAIGMDAFESMLEGMYQADCHFKSAPLRQNIPVLMGLLQVWYSNFWGAQAQAILPYAQHLHRLPAYLTQLEMESLGKSVTRDGKLVEQDTGAIIFGEMGCNAQHSFYQLLHQGTRLVMVDFIAPINGPHRETYHQQLTLANCLAQSRALAFGYDADEVEAELAAKGQVDADLVPAKIHSGNRPNNLFLIDSVTPSTLGMLIALYEHKVLVQAAIWDINAFDQWGVELGKKLAQSLTAQIGTAPTTTVDSSTDALLTRIARDWRYC